MAGRAGWDLCPPARSELGHGAAPGASTSSWLKGHTNIAPAPAGLNNGKYLVLGGSSLKFSAMPSWP